MNYTLHYSSTRAEVWKWYWRAWTGGLWQIHVIFAVGIGFVLSGAKPNLEHALHWLIYSLGVFPVLVAFFAAFPQILFKSKLRTLEVGPEGWVTKIGKISGSRKWSEIESVMNVAGSIQIKGKNGNALIVPSRAFDSSIHMEKFISDAKEWHRNNG